jgi:hypothetical protein
MNWRQIPQGEIVLFTLLFLNKSVDFPEIAESERHLVIARPVNFLVPSLLKKLGQEIFFFYGEKLRTTALTSAVRSAQMVAPEEITQSVKRATTMPSNNKHTVRRIVNTRSSNDSTVGSQKSSTNREIGVGAIGLFFCCTGRYSLMNIR